MALSPRLMVKFWSHQANYEQFVKACEIHGVKPAEVLNEFLDWYVEKTYDGQVKKNHI